GITGQPVPLVREPTRLRCKRPVAGTRWQCPAGMWKQPGSPMRACIWIRRRIGLAGGKMETSLLVFAAAVVGSSIGPLVVALMNLRTAHKDRVEGRRKEKLEYFDRKLQALIELRGDLQWYQQGFDRFETEASKRREIS